MEYCLVCDYNNHIYINTDINTHLHKFAFYMYMYFDF